MGKTIYEELTSAAAACTCDLAGASDGAEIGLEARVRAYDLMDRILEVEDMLEKDASFAEAAAAYCRQYEKSADIADSGVETALKAAEDSLAVYQTRLNDARFEAAAAASLHEFAKEVFHIWQTEGIFARRRALRELRERAGFRLESHRIGNYVAKTFDLMNEAQVRFAGAQQALFAADVRYKICQGTYGKIYQILCNFADL